MAVAFSKQTAFNDANVKVGTFPQAITVNASTNMLVLCVTTYDGVSGSGQSATPSGIATTWTKVALNKSTTGGGQECIWIGSGTLTTGTLTLTFSASTFFAANCSEWSGLSTTVDSAIAWGTPDWGNTGSIGYANNSGTGNQTISAPSTGSLIVHCVDSSNDATTFTYGSSTTAQTSLTGAKDTSANCALAAAYAIWASSGTYSMGVPSGTPAAASTDGWCAVAIRASGAVVLPPIPYRIARQAVNRAASF